MAEKSGFEALLKKRDVCRKGGAAGGDKVLRGHRKNSNRYAQVLKTEKHSKVSRSLIFKLHKRFADGRDS
jgi:hypothetical protein